MDQRFWSKKIGSDQGLQFRLELAQDDPRQRQALAWGPGEVWLDGEPLWHGFNEDGSQAPVEWSWIDLLTYLGRHWPWLMLEESYPVLPAREKPPATPLQYRQTLADRWESVAEETMLQEEEQVFLFEDRHNLARGMQGIFLPSLYILREGNQCWVCSTEATSLLLPFDQVHDTLQELGDWLADFVRPHLDSEFGPRARTALEWWGSREQRCSQMLFQLQTGMPVAELAKLHGETPAATFFEMVEEAGQEASGSNSLLAAARMSAGVVPVDMQRALLNHLRGLPKRQTPELDALSSEAHHVPTPSASLHQQGYELANWLRTKLQLSDTDLLDPEALLKQWNVVIEEIDFPKTPLSAIAAWGEKHGPGILLNTGLNSLATHIHGRRTTLAHEICHLLVDRRTALPAAEILGGKTPEFPEKRARAFAAELLLPRHTVYELLDPLEDIEQSMQMLSHRFGVSTQVAANQLRNSDRFQDLGYDQRILVNTTADQRFTPRNSRGD